MNNSVIKLGDIMVGRGAHLHVYISANTTSRIVITASSIVVRQYGCTYAHALWTHLPEREVR
jgi:hypothetical protein